MYIVEKNSEAGGLLRRFRYGEWGNFDYGMHNMLQTGIDKLDRLIFELLPEEEWQMLEDGQRDLAGIYFNGILQKNTPYIDLRGLSMADYKSCLVALFEHFAEPHHSVPEPELSAEQYAVARFGEIVARKTIIPAVQKIHQKKASELDYMATIFTPMTRLAFCDAPLVAEITSSTFLRDRVAWSDQRTLPLERSSGRSGFYPVRYGIYRVVEAILAQLADAGARLLTETEITDVQTKDGFVSTVNIRSKNETSVLEEVEDLIWTANIPLLGRFLGVNFDGLKYDKPLKTIVVNLVVDRLPEHMGDLYHFFCYDSDFRTYRLTNFSNYCRGAARNGGYPVSVELLMDDEAVQGADLEQLAIDEYHRFGVGHADTKILFAKAEILASGFPMPSINNIHALRSIRDSIHAMHLSNLQMMGILAEDNLFFQTDVLADVYRKLN